MYKDDLIDAWIEAEENLGLKSCIYFWDNGTTTQWVDSEEAEEFHKMAKEEDFEYWFEVYFKALEKKDLVKTFMCLSIFNEIDEHPEIATEDELRRLKRIRELTHEMIYNMN